ncbi:MAG: hypothetical protein MUO26_10010 [Methanotrichaceae archaeon]|nr:hypothetical protein [Methanotrichaceae archaeon]
MQRMDPSPNYFLSEDLRGTGVESTNTCVTEPSILNLLTKLCNPKYLVQVSERRLLRPKFSH